MQTFSAVSLILAAAAMLFLFVRPISPRFTAGEYVSRSAALLVVKELSKKCASTERGRGVTCVLLYAKMRKLMADIEHKKDRPWARMLAADDVISVAMMSTARTVNTSYMLPHVGIYPRVYLFCDALLSRTFGGTTPDIIRDALAAFEERAPLNSEERAALPDILTFCIIGHIFSRISERGGIDCASVKYSLDTIAYLCGIQRDEHAAEISHGYFCGEPVVRRVVFGNVTADNRGNIILNGGRRVSLMAALGEHEITLAACDGVFMPHAVLYRTVTADVDVSWTVISHELGCAIRLTVINRTESAAEVEVRAVCDGAALCIDSAAGGESVIELAAFEKRSAVIGVFVCENYKLGRTFSSCDGVCFSRLYINAASEHAGETIGPCDISDDIFTGAQAPPLPYGDVDIPLPELLFKTVYGGCTDGGDIVMVKADNDTAETVVLSEGGAIWTPYAALVSKRSHDEYLSGKNGALTVLKRYRAADGGEISDITLENMTPALRHIYAMLIAPPGTDILTSERVFERTDSREAFFRHGRIERAHGFYTGGETPISALSVRLCLLPFSRTRTVFCTAKSGGATEINAYIADACLAESEKKAYGIGRITPHTADRIVDIAYDISLRAALSAVGGGDGEALISCFAEKYVCEEAVRAAILNSCGDSSLVLPLAVSDYVRFSGDTDLYGEAVGKNTVLGVCFDRISAAVSIYTELCDTDILMLKRCIAEFMQHCAGTERSRIYARALGDMRAAYISARENILRDCKRDKNSMIAACSLMYRSGDGDGAYAILKELAAAVIAEPFSAVNALFYPLVTEGLLGISLGKDRVSFCPCLPGGMPDIELDVSVGGVKRHVTLDGSESDGSWRLTAGGITYGAAALGGESTCSAVIRRSGEKCGA